MSVDAQHEAFAEPNVLKEKAAARYLGTSISTLRRRRKALRPPRFVQLDRCIGYRKRDLDQFLDDHTVETHEQPPRKRGPRPRNQGVQ